MKIHIDIEKQRLILLDGKRRLQEYDISSAKNGAGCRENSFQTPVGRHRIYEKIGDNYLLGSVFVGRKATGEIYSEELSDAYPNRDWILSRILWLEGCEQGVNKGGEVDSRRRYIYIHGTNEESLIGVPASHGCIRMRGGDLLALYDQVSIGCEVYIESI